MANGIGLLTAEPTLTVHCVAGTFLFHTMLQVQPQALARTGTQVKGTRVQITMVSMFEIISAKMVSFKLLGREETSDSHTCPDGSRMTSPFKKVKSTPRR